MRWHPLRRIRTESCGIRTVMASGYASTVAKDSWITKQGMEMAAQTIAMILQKESCRRYMNELLASRLAVRSFDTVTDNRTRIPLTEGGSDEAFQWGMHFFHDRYDNGPPSHSANALAGEEDQSNNGYTERRERSWTDAEAEAFWDKLLGRE